MKNQLTLRESINYCRKLSWQSGSSFYLPFWLLNRREFEAMCVLYAFFRISDDLVDDKQNSQIEPALNLKAWQENLHSLITEQESVLQHQINPALKWLLTEISINPEWLNASLTGAARDLVPVKLETSSELDQYCYEVAGTVGLSCLAIWGTTDPEIQQLGILCGRAFQRTNILRDIKEDHLRNRYYIPMTHQQQIESSLIESKFTPELNQQLQHFMEITARYFEQSVSLGKHIPSKGGRKMFYGIYNIYYALFKKIESSPQLILQQRISIPKIKKIWHTLHAATNY